MPVVEANTSPLVTSKLNGFIPLKAILQRGRCKSVSSCNETPQSNGCGLRLNITPCSPNGTTQINVTCANGSCRQNCQCFCQGNGYAISSYRPCDGTFQYDAYYCSCDFNDQ